MNDLQKTGRIVGLLLLIAMIIGMYSNFALNDPIFGGAGYLVNGLQHRTLFGLNVVADFINSSIGITVAVLVYSKTWRNYPKLSMTYLSVVIVSVAVGLSEQAHFMSLLSLSEQFAKHPALDPQLFDVMKAMISADRNWHHFIGKISGGASLFLLYVLLYRTQFIFRLISLFGMFAAAMQMSGISVEFFSHDLNKMMLYPMGIAHLILIICLLIKGFSEKTPDKHLT